MVLEKIYSKGVDFFQIFMYFLRIIMNAPLEILKFPDSRLRQKGQAVRTVTPELRQFAKDLLETMYKEKGVGLAAVQVNKPIRLFVADTKRSSDRYDA